MWLIKATKNSQLLKTNFWTKRYKRMLVDSMLRKQFQNSYKKMLEKYNIDCLINIAIINIENCINILNNIVKIDSYPGRKLNSLEVEYCYKQILKNKIEDKYYYLLKDFFKICSKNKLGIEFCM